MELFSMMLPASTAILILYLFNRVFHYKDKLVNIFGIIKYKVTLLTITLTLFFIMTYKYEILISKNPVGVFILFSYMYLVYVPNKTR